MSEKAIWAQEKCPASARCADTGWITDTAHYVPVPCQWCIEAFAASQLETIRKLKKERDHAIAVCAIKTRFLGTDTCVLCNGTTQVKCIKPGSSPPSYIYGPCPRCNTDEFVNGLEKITTEEGKINV